MRPRSARFTEDQQARLAQLRWQSGKHIDVRSFNENGTIDFLRGQRLESPVEPDSGQTVAAATAERFLSRNGPLLLLEDPQDELALLSETGDRLGYTQLRYEQRYGGLSVWPSGLLVQTRPGGHVHLVTARTFRLPMRFR